MSAPGPDALRLMQGLAQTVMAQRLELVNANATVGELAWVWGKDVGTLAPHWRHRLWFEGGRLAGFAWAHLPHRVLRSDGTIRDVAEADLVWQTHPARPELLGEMLDWYDAEAAGADRLLTLQSADTAARAIAEAQGYRLDAAAADAENGSWHQFNARDLAEVPAPALPSGFRFLSAGDVSVAAAAQAHRDAWHPSSFTAQSLAQVRGTWPYRADLHVLVAAPDGTLAASAIIWLDAVTRTAEFEPVGTHRDFRRRGLGTALLLHGMGLARAAGAARMLVACLGAAGRSAARGLYCGVGFAAFTRDVPMVKGGG